MLDTIQELLYRRGVVVARASHMEGYDWPKEIAKVTEVHNVRTILDVGANVGQSARTLSRLFPHAQIHSFEPVTRSFQEGRRNTEGISQITWHPTAVGNREGTVVFYSEGRSQLASLRDAGADFAAGKVDRNEVEIIRLDDFCARNAIADVGILKTDTEGFDLDVLRGAGCLLRSGAVRFIICEVGFMRADSGHSFFPDILEFLDECGYTVLKFYHMSTFQEFGIDGSCHADALFGRYRNPSEQQTLGTKPR